MVNFTCQLEWTNCKTVFLGVSVKVSSKEITIWISRLSKEDRSHQGGWTPSNPLRAWLEQKCWGWTNSLSAWAETFIFSCFQISMLWTQAFRLRSRHPPHTHTPLILRHSDTDYITPLTSPVCRWQVMWLLGIHKNVNNWYNKYTYLLHV